MYISCNSSPCETLKLLHSHTQISPSFAPLSLYWLPSFRSITRRTVAREERGRPCDLQKAFSVPWRGQCPPQGPSSSFPTVPSSRPALGPQGYRSSSVSVANYAVLKTKIMLYLSCILSNPLKLPLNVKVNCWFTTADL